MNNLQPSTYVVPVVILVLVAFLYFLLLKRTADKGAFKRFTLRVIFWAFVLNFAWEMLQMPLYENMPLTWSTTLYCTLASIADVLMVLLIYYVFGLIYRNPLWAQDLTLQRITVLMLIGGIGAILAEMRHLSLGNWNYSEAMPLLPVVNAGLSPVLQFMVLPSLVYYLSEKFSNKGEEHLKSGSTSSH